MKHYLGIDAGSSWTKLVLLGPVGVPVARRLVSSRGDMEQICRMGLADLLSEACMERSNLAGIASTGYGRRRVSFADRVLTEITALAAGAFHLEPQTRLVLDVGGQDSKAVVLGEQGGVIDFALNSKCAAGTGRFLEVTCASLGVALEDLAALSQQADKPLVLSSTCTVFAESEIVSHRAAGEKTANIVAALHAAVVDQLLALLHQVGLPPEGPIFFTGGVAQNGAIADLLSEKLKREVRVPPHPQHIGALGAALSLNGVLP